VNAAREVQRLSVSRLPIEKCSAPTRQANSLSLVRFDANDYSVPTAYAHQPITIVGGLDEVRLVCRDRLVARHRRQWGPDQVAGAGEEAEDECRCHRHAP
jgi:hypothetical protein